MRHRIAVAVLLVAVAPLVSGFGMPATTVYLNGVPAPVFFNDGDSFLVLAGRFQGGKARLTGFNTLESYGPAHVWGGWTAKEMYHLAKMATLNARRGVWHCESDLKTDTYGRTLWWCPDLAADQVKYGLAHTMAVGDDAGRPELLKVQHEAMAARRGMWAKGVPVNVLTSLHSMDETTGEFDGNYNRLVSTVDGRSTKWKHENVYPECTTVCSRVPLLAPARAAEIVGGLRRDDETGPVLAPFNDATLVAAVRTYYATKRLPLTLDAGISAQMLGRLEEARAGLGGDLADGDDSCMIYVDFRRRFALPKPECLK